MNESPLEALRGATRDHHDEIESLLRLTDPIPLPRYIAILSGFEAFLAHWEPRIEAALPARLLPWWHPRRRRAFAQDDLHCLASTTDHPPALTTPGAAQAALASVPLTTLPQAFGSMYVIEGSALGGQVITPKLGETLGVRPGAGASYFHGFGSDTGGMWRDFRDTLAREVPATHPALGQACEAARATFAALIALFRTLPA